MPPPDRAALADPGFAEPLGDGLVRRWSTPADTARLAHLLGVVFRDPEDELPNPRPMHEGTLLMQTGFPYMTPGDVAVVEDTARDGRPLVACTCLWRHTWSYAGIPFGVTRPEMVATDPAYRRRGLVRALLDMVHARGDGEGRLLSAITGISYFYRQFGYEYALDLEGGRTTYLSLVPRRGPGREACRLDAAGPADAPALAAMYAARRAGSLVWHEADEARWRWMVEIWDEPSMRGADPARVGIGARYWTIRAAGGAVCGYVLLPIRRWGASLRVLELGFTADADLPALVPSLLRRLKRQAERTPAMRPDAPACSEIRFDLGPAHPVFDVLGDALAPRVHPPYAWYVRVPAVRPFLELIRPALEERLARSPLRAYSGTARLDLYREGVELRLERGRLTGVEPWQAPDYGQEEPALECPPLTFLQLLLGHRSVAELERTYPDVNASDEGRLLVTTLFPRLPSTVEPLG